MERIRRLKHEALKQCLDHHHYMDIFYRLYVNVTTGQKTTWWRSRCKVCNKFVDIDHDSDIHGPAITENCSDFRYVNINLKIK